jgi:ESS family glutamate:Na+ symporter
MPVWFQSIVILFIVWVVARGAKRNVALLQRYFIPSSLIGGVILLLISHQVMGIIPESLAKWIAALPAVLINIVFAAMFIGHKRPTVKQVWEQAGPMIAFGNTIAWGMYVIGILLVLLILGPLFGTPPLFGALLEISFSGGHGTAAGLAPTFAKLGQPQATDVALGLATLSIVTAVISGIAIINIYNHRTGRVFDRATMQAQQRRMIRNGYDLTRVTKNIESKPKDTIIAIVLLGSGVAIGWLLLQLLTWGENVILGSFTDIRVFAHLPLFPLAMFGGLIVQWYLELFHLERTVNLRTIQTLSAITLDLLIVTAIGTMSLNVIGHNFAAFMIIAVTGIVWILGAFAFLAPKFFHKHWFEYGMTDMGQAMGMTATGLLLNRLVDPLNRTGARESFAYKQLAYEPFMGGGIVTAFAVVAIVEFGQLTVLGVSAVVFLFWLILGLHLGRKNRRRLHHDRNIASYAMRAS